MINFLLKLFTRKPEDHLQQRIERYVSPRSTRVNCGLHNAIHTKLAEELRGEG